MPLTPKSPGAPSRLPGKPATPVQPRPPKRLAPTPTRPQQKAKRIPTTPHPTPNAMTPLRAPRTTPTSARRNKSDRTATISSPERTANADAGSRVVQKRIIWEPATKRALPATTPVISTPKRKSMTGKTVNPSNDVSPAAKIHKKRQPKVRFAKSVTDNPSSEDKKTDKNIQVTEDAPQRKVSRTKRDSKVTKAKPSKGDHSQHQDENIVPKSKTKKKRATAGRFDLHLPDDNGEEALSPSIVINESMSESKLQLLESSPLNRLIPAKDRKAAAAEVAAQKIASAHKEGKRSSGLNSKDLFVPLDKSANDATSRDTVEDAKLEAVRKKEARKMKWKARQMRKRGELPDKDSEEHLKRTGVVYLGHIPHGFYEKEMRSYFSQFGEVTRLRLSRSKKTGRSRGFAFLEFADANVASIAAEAMDGYLMHGQALVAKFVPEEKVHPDTFKGADRTFRKVPWSSIERRKMIARAKDPLKLATRSRRVKKMSKQKLKLLSKKGIKYDFPEQST